MSTGLALEPRPPSRPGCCSRVHVALQVFFVGRALLRPHREPASRLAWVVVIIVAPVVGMLAYVLFGETNIGRRRIARFKRAMARLPAFADIGRHEGEGDEAGRPGRATCRSSGSASRSPASPRSAATAAGCSATATT